ncbi:MAG: rod shape-determining protein MreC [Gemmatimonadetes bacterium]|nr:rod shape-determining protein MreC [Gemmatimonadota bacterium]
MQRFYEFIGQKRAYFTLGISVVLSFVLMSLGHSEKLALARSVATGLLETGHRVFAWPIELSGLRYANEALREQNLRLSMELVRLREAKLENQRLREMLNFRARHAGKGEHLAAKVIAKDPDRIANTILIDLGKSDGITERMPVVTAEGLVGRVLESYDGTSVVQLLLDRNCRVSAVVQRASRTQGIVMVEDSGFHLNHVPLRSDIEVGDEVVSSGLGGIFPHGLLAGRVIALGDEESGLFREVELEPAVDFSNLEEVFVLKVGEGQRN